MSEIEEIMETIKQKLGFMVNPEIEELVLVPDFLMIPSLQRIRQAPYKFKKYFNEEYKYVVLYDGEGLFIVRDFKVDFIFQTRRSKRLYMHVFRDFPLPLSVLTYEGGEPIVGFPNEKEIAKRFFALDLEFGNKVIEQGHLTAIQLKSIRNIEHWWKKETQEIFDHKLSKPAWNITDEIYYLDASEEVKVTHSEHKEITIPQGEWLLYHPEPSKKID